MNRDARLAAVDSALNEYLATGPGLFAVPGAYVPLSVFVAAYQAWLPDNERPLWKRGRIEAELGSQVGTIKENSKAIKVLKGYTYADPDAKEREAQAEAQRFAEAAEARRMVAEEAAREAAEASRLARAELVQKEESRRVEAAEAERLATAEAERLAKHEAAREAADALGKPFRVGLCERYMEYVPGSRVTVNDIAARFGQLLGVPLACEQVEICLSAFRGGGYLKDGYLLDHRFLRALVRSDGNLKERWDEGDHGRGSHLPKRSPGKTMLYPRDHPEMLADPVAVAYFAAWDMYWDRPACPWREPQ